ncbi:MAG: hypothetical protein LBH54_01865 [Clostridiales bacterium]|nr:hypothetical protein [Clostridiales bacterium]
MKKIGFIDYYLDEWHADNYPGFIKKHGGAFQVASAWAKCDKPGGVTNAEWSRRTGIPLAQTIEEVVEHSDCIVVLSPDNPEQHETLVDLPLRSGKPVYVDKTFAPDLAAAKRMFDLADAHGTPCYSCSALGFVEEYSRVERAGIETVQTVGPGSFAIYSIHQIEPIIYLTDGVVKRVMSVGTARHPALVFAFADGRTARTAHFANAGFSAQIGYADGHSQSVEVKSDLFERFIAEMLQFFETGEIPVPHARTLAIMAARHAGQRALETPFTWVNVEA